MDRRTFVKGATLATAAGALPITIKVAPSAAGIAVHREYVEAYEPLAIHARAFAHSVTIGDPERYVRHLYKKLLGYQPARDALTRRVRMLHDPDGHERLLTELMQRPEFAKAYPPFVDLPRRARISESHMTQALSLMAQTERLWEALYARTPTGLEVTETVLSVATLLPVTGTRTTILPPHTSSRLQWARAWAEMDYAGQETVATPVGAIPVGLVHQFNAATTPYGMNQTLSFATLTAIAAMAVALSMDISFAIGQAAAGLAEGTISATVNAVQGLISLAGMGMLTLGALVLTVKVTTTQISVTVSSGGSTSVGTPANGPSQNSEPVGTVTVGEISVVDAGPGSASDGGVGNAGIGEGSGGSGPGGTSAW